MSARGPPSIYAWLEQALSPSYHVPFPSLDTVLQQTSSQTLKRASAYFFPRTTAIKKYLVTLHALELPPDKQVEAVVKAGISAQTLETFPEAVFGIINDSIMKCQSSPPTTWTSNLLQLVGREDLMLLAQSSLGGSSTMSGNSVSL